MISARPLTENLTVAGLDGCRSGWCMVVFPDGDVTRPALHALPHIQDVLIHPTAPAILAIDMPIGLPDKSIKGGRPVEPHVRPLLGQRQSSVFSVPARAAVMETDYKAACDMAMAHSDPPRKVSKQCFYLFPKIREVDAIMSPNQEDRIFEVHPELAFWRLNGDTPVASPKKIKGRVNPEGITERQALLMRQGVPETFFDKPRPTGVGADDRVDATACALIALRLSQGLARPFPEAYERDGHGLRMAIWA